MKNVKAKQFGKIYDHNDTDLSQIVFQGMRRMNVNFTRL